MTVIISQNALAKILKVYEEANRAIEYKMKFNKQDLLTVCALWVDILDLHFEKNDNFECFAS